MNVTKEQLQRIISILLGAVLAVAAVLGWVIDPVQPSIDLSPLIESIVNNAPVVNVDVPKQAPPVVEIYPGEDEFGDITSYSITGSGGDFGDITVTGMTNSGNMSAVGGTFSGNVSAVDGTFSGDVSVAGTLTSGGVAQLVTNGGSATSVVSGTTIAHGLTVTPTVAMLTPGSTTTYTSTVFVLATDATSITVGVEAGVTVPTVYWLAGK